MKLSRSKKFSLKIISIPKRTHDGTNKRAAAEFNAFFVHFDFGLLLLFCLIFKLNFAAWVELMGFLSAFIWMKPLHSSLIIKYSTKTFSQPSTTFAKRKLISHRFIVLYSFCCVSPVVVVLVMSHIFPPARQIT